MVTMGDMGVVQFSQGKSEEKKEKKDENRTLGGEKYHPHPKQQTKNKSMKKTRKNSEIGKNNYPVLVGYCFYVLPSRVLTAAI